MGDASGVVQCPFLRSYTCPICGVSGDHAHTLRYCPLNKDGRWAPTRSISELRRRRKSDGKYRREADYGSGLPLPYLQQRSPAIGRYRPEVDHAFGLPLTSLQQKSPTIGRYQREVDHAFGPPLEAPSSLQQRSPAIPTPMEGHVENMIRKWV